MSSKDDIDFVKTTESIVDILDEVLSLKVSDESLKYKCFLGLTRLFTVPLITKKCLITSLESFLRFMDIKEKHTFTFTWVVIVTGINAAAEDTFRLNVYTQMDKLGYYNVLSKFMNTISKDIDSDIEMWYPITLILEHLIWLLKKSVSFPSSIALQTKIRQLVFNLIIILHFINL